MKIQIDPGRVSVRFLTWAGMTGKMSPSETTDILRELALIFAVEEMDLDRKDAGELATAILDNSMDRFEDQVKISEIEKRIIKEMKVALADAMNHGTNS